ncbi:hypothetical protein PTKIN_Ptkin02bG0130100 [Pterospermum kingtungense]
MFMNAYKYALQPINGPHEWKKCGLEPILPPFAERTLERLKKNRRKSKDEPSKRKVTNMVGSYAAATSNAAFPKATSTKDASTSAKHSSFDPMIFSAKTFSILSLRKRPFDNEETGSSRCNVRRKLSMFPISLQETHLPGGADKGLWKAGHTQPPHQQ